MVENTKFLDELKDAVAAEDLTEVEEEEAEDIGASYNGANTNSKTGNNWNSVEGVEEQPTEVAVEEEEGEDTGEAFVTTEAAEAETEGDGGWGLDGGKELEQIMGNRVYSRFFPFVGGGEEAAVEEEVAGDDDGWGLGETIAPLGCEKCTFFIKLCGNFRRCSSV